MIHNRRLDEARDAFARRDLASSGRVHRPEVIARAMERPAGAGHQYIGDMAYGGLDGIITTFAVVSGVSGAVLGSGIIHILGLASLLATGPPMATGATCPPGVSGRTMTASDSASRGKWSISPRESGPSSSRSTGPRATAPQMRKHSSPSRARARSDGSGR